MITLDNYSSVLPNSSIKVANAHLNQSANIIENTWNYDPQVKPCYIYDYMHDDVSEVNKNYNIQHNTVTTNKTAISCKYVITQYPTISTTDVEYIVQFKPSQTCCLTYYDSFYETPYGMEFPIGMYLDIPDEQGIYRKWLICFRDMELEFISYHILRCNYYFHWIKNGIKHKMWGVMRNKNSSGAGVDSGSKTQQVDANDQFWLPKNIYSDDLTYDDRLIISSVRPDPFVWSVSKIENLYPIGINKLILSQDKFNSTTDYIPLIKETPYEMYANYYSSYIIPTDNPTTIVTTDYGKVISTNNNIKVNGNYKIMTVKFYNKDNTELTNYKISTNKWTFIGTDNVNYLTNNLITLVQNGTDYSSIKIKFTGNENYLGKIINCSVTDDNNIITAIMQLEIISL